MAEVRRRNAARTKAADPVRRRRDRAAEVDEDEEEDDDVDATGRPARARKATKATKKRRPAPVVEEDEDEDEEDLEDEEDDDEEEEDEEPPPPRRKKAAATKKAARRRPAPVDEDDEDDDEDEEPAPRRRSTKSRRGGPKPPPGIRVGAKGAEETTKSAGGAQNRLTLTKDPQLIKALEKEPFASYRQHWVGSGQGSDRPYTCIGTDCPLCASGDNSSATYAFNVLLFSEDEEPKNKILQVGVKAYKAFQDTATGKDGKVRYDKDFWAISRSGKGNEVQTNFRPLKQRDLDEDWVEIYDQFEPEEMDEIIAEATENVFDYTVIQASTLKQLKEVAKYLADDDED